MIQALVVSNGIGGAAFYQSNAEIHYDVAEVTADFDPDLTPYDLLVVPNGSDHVAMLKIRDKVRAFLETGKTVMCFDGWFTNWLPGNRWIHDNTRPTKDVRHFIRTDRHQLLEGVDLRKFDHEKHGMSGWWACGRIECPEAADVVLADTWQRPLVVLDEVTTPGLMFLTASGPLGDFTFYGDPDGIPRLYRNALRLVANRLSGPSSDSRSNSTSQLQPA
ncbi:MAG: hypothetical protein V4726_22495 [Verrucomicrobiota bacterium]